MTIIDTPISDVVIFDHLTPEENAMVMAMYSRDPRSVRIHLEHVARVGTEKFMGTYYVGYGDKSIGDCGSTNICAELISMLAAKAIQQNPMYNGQEASTRYLPMMNQPVLNPLGNEHGRKIQERWMEMYVSALDKLVPYLTEKYPRLEGEDLKVYNKAIKVKAFDIARSFLPAGCTTYVGWHTNIRQAWDHLREMQYHPLPEVSDLAGKILKDLRDKYTNSFSFRDRPEQEAYLIDCAEFTYFDEDIKPGFHTENTLKLDGLRNQKALKVLSGRKVKTELPDWFNRYGQLHFQSHIDFGSFRELQRHRSATQLMPLLTTRHGFHKWYIDSLPEEMVSDVYKLLVLQETEIAKIEDPLVRQYYIAMGYNVVSDLTGGLPSCTWIAELRSTQAVHGTLRPLAQQIGTIMQELLPEMALYVDYSPDEWSTKRGTQDIVKKEE